MLRNLVIDALNFLIDLASVLLWSYTLSLIVEYVKCW